MATYEKYGQPNDNLMLSHTDQLLGFIWGKLDILGGGLGTGLATEATLSALKTVMEGFKDDEVLVARDTVTGILYVLEIRIAEGTGVRTQSFYTVAGVPFTPVNPMELIGASDLAVHVANAPYTNGNLGVEVLAVRNDNSATVVADTDGDYSVITTDEYGVLFVYDNELKAKITSLSGSDDGVSTLQGFGMMGKAVTSATYVATYSDSDWVMPAFDKASGRLLNSAKIEAGTALIGKVGIDQTTPGTTNGVVEASAAAIKTAVEIIDNFISGSRGLVTEDNSAAIAASLSVMDDWDESDRAKVNPIAGQAGVQGNTGVVNALTQRVTLATDIALPAGENHLGSIGGNTAVVSSTIVMSAAGAYATGDYMGTTTAPQSFANAVRVAAGTGILKSLVISDKITTTNVAMELWILSTTFTAPTDNAAWAISDAEALTVQAIIPITTSGWYASSNNQVYVDGSLSIPIKVASGTGLFYALVARGTTPAFTDGDLTITVGILQD